MIAQDFTRNDCKLGKRCISYARLEREYRCNECDGRLAQAWSAVGWYIRCARCGSVDFAHENEIARQAHEAVEVLAGLPPELAALLNGDEQ